MIASKSSYVSGSADEAWAALSEMYTSARPHETSADAQIRFDTVATPSLAVDRGWLHSAGGAFDPSPGQLNIISVLDGQISLDFGKSGCVFNRAGDSYLYLPDSSANLEWRDFGALATRVPMEVVTRTASELTGVDSVRFTSPAPVSVARAGQWSRTAQRLWRELSALDGLLGSDLIYSALLTMTATAALSVFPNTTLVRDYEPGPGSVGPAALRRAVEFIEAHASLPITVTDIACAAGTDARGLREAFRRNLETTPSHHLRNVRLEAVHRDLQAADPVTDTVWTIAGRWGFSPRSHFTRYYESRFGVAPRLTLEA